MRSLAGLDVLVLDCQATGASPTFGHVLELGWGVARAGEDTPRACQAHWIALPEGHTVPGQVRKLTGWEPAAAETAIADGEAWRRLRSAVTDAAPIPTAIHYARFELPFLRAWAARFEPDAAFPFDAVCVFAIANRLYPNLPRLGLRALAGYLGHGVALQRRALGHVTATAFVWQRLCAELGGRGVNTWEDLQGWLGEKAPARARPKKPQYPIDSQRFRSLPDQPGVYRFLRCNGDLLYVGKAASLKKRTTSHFIGRTGKLLAPEMLTQVADIAVTVTASALEAALLENETIKTLNPPYNVQLTAGDPRVWYSTPAFDAAASAPGDAHSLGPLASEYSLRPLGALDALLEGAPATLAIRAHAVGVSALWTPDETVFAAGWALLMARHAPGDGTEPARWRALQLARHLVAVVAAQEDDERETGDEDHAWDPERVARHVERAAAQAYRAHRRARWLRLLQDSDVVYREPAASQARRLSIRDGQISTGAESPPADAAPFDR
ncbi:MAG TPA: GIY-YIG nuclease family protein, partial [Burkholderiaceae bacterium]|nr:GIY-YIG nuclease family protein [Burkholderiaceae bacterium]